jgi:hypothetical protein
MPDVVDTNLHGVSSCLLPPTSESYGGAVTIALWMRVVVGLMVGCSLLVSWWRDRYGADA